MSICSKDELENPDGNSNLITTDKYEINKYDV